MPLKLAISLNAPCSVPSADAPLSPMMYVDQRVVEHAEILERIDQPADVMVGVLEEAGVDLHLALEHRLERRDPCRPRPGSPRGAA